MKKLFFIFFCTILSACSFNKNESSVNNAYIEESDTIQKVNNTNTKLLSIYFQNIKYSKIEKYENYFNEHMLYTPTYAEIKIKDNEYKKIMFIYDYDFPVGALTDEDTKYFESDSIKEYPPIYEAELSKIEENIYFAHNSIKGIPSWGNRFKLMSKEKDFYLIKKGDKYYITFDNLEINELRNYENDVYWIERQVEE